MRILALAAMLVTSFAFTTPAQVDTRQCKQKHDLEPASVLLFPTVDSRDGLGKGTVISVSNTSDERLVCKNNFRRGDVQLHYYYVEGLEPFNNVFNRKEFLTPNDTLTVLAGSHNPEMELGYLLVISEDPESEDAIKFNRLIGDEIVVDVLQNKLWQIPAIGFRAHAQKVSDEGDQTIVRDNCGRRKTDLNKNGSVDFDGEEYDCYPDKLFISSFFEQSATMEAELILVSGLGSYYQLDLDFLFYDNEEDVYSRDFEFTCWTSVTLDKISAVTKSLGGSASEPATGWARIDGDYAIHILTGKRWTNEKTGGSNFDPPVDGAMVQRIKGATGFEFGHLLHHTGRQNGNEFPWRLADDYQGNS